MKSATRLMWVLVAQLGLFPVAASAAVIVDTGPSPNIGSADPGVIIDNGNDGYLQYLAGEFTTTQSYDITGLAAFVRQYACCDTITATFHLGLATGPTTPAGSTFADLFSLPVTFTAVSGAAGWAGADVPDYSLAAGTYWIVVSATSSDDPIGLGMPEGVPDPLSGYATTVDAPNDWQPLQPMPLIVPVPPTLGFQVEGTPVSTVPSPDTLGLLCGGIGALAALRRRLPRMRGAAQPLP
jgi:hypothetical protein